MLRGRKDTFLRGSPLALLSAPCDGGDDFSAARPMRPLMHPLAGERENVGVGSWSHGRYVDIAETELGRWLTRSALPPQGADHIGSGLDLSALGICEPSIGAGKHAGGDAVHPVRRRNNARPRVRLTNANCDIRRATDPRQQPRGGNRNIAFRIIAPIPR